jgi:acyl-CoA synthetase (AMP-forming)/AMP-acid ligase II
MQSHFTVLYPLAEDLVEQPTYFQILKSIFIYGFDYFRQMLKTISKPIMLLFSMPPYSGAGFIGAINTFLTGKSVVHVDRFLPTAYLNAIEKEKVNVVSFPPALATMMVRHPDIDKYDLSSLLYIALGTAPTPPALVDELLEKFNRPVMVGYGTSELVGGITMTRPFADPPRVQRETVGRVLKGWELMIVDEDRRPLPTGEIGELAVKGGLRMLGYYKAEELTRATFQDGWYYTGDLATIDEEGYVRIVGRLKDMIIRAGQNIYPAEVESVLITHPEIRDAAVVGIPDPISGEKVLAYVIPQENHQLNELSVLEFCRENMAAYKVASNVFFVDDFPLTATGKVLKRELREDAVERFSKP